MDALGLDLRGRIDPDERAETGRAVARLDGLGWSGPLRDLFTPTTSDGETPVPLRTAAVRVLDDWLVPDGAGTVDCVVGIRSATRPQLVAHLAGGLARYLGVPVAGSVGPVVGREEPGSHDVNSAARLAGVVRRLGPDEGLDVTGKRVLLVDDRTDSGWTLTVVARALRRAGATAVLPFVLAVG